MYWNYKVVLLSIVTYHRTVATLPLLDLFCVCADNYSSDRDDEVLLSHKDRNPDDFSHQYSDDWDRPDAAHCGLQSSGSTEWSHEYPIQGFVSETSDWSSDRAQPSTSNTHSFDKKPGFRTSTWSQSSSSYSFDRTSTRNYRDNWNSRHRGRSQHSMSKQYDATSDRYNALIFVFVLHICITVVLLMLKGRNRKDL